MLFVHSWPSASLALMVLQVEVSVTKGLVCTCTGNRIASMMGREAAMPAKASARPFSVRLIFSIVHSVNRYKVSLTLVDIASCVRPWLHILSGRVLLRVANRYRP